jgi:succinoglycan biosynthesis protein ExoM
MTSEVSICIATHRRPEGLERLLASLADQKHAPPFDVIVVDNDAARSGEAIAARFQDRLALSYLVEPVRGLAQVRNCAVAVARSPFMAFIDDDEWAVPEWLAAHARTAKASKADITVGPVRRVFADGVPDYIRNCGSFENVFYTDGAILPWHAVYGGNTFIRRDALPDLRAPFSSQFDLTGGEDVQLFKQMIERGARAIAAAHAVVFEYRSANRANLRWLVRRGLRNGGTIVTAEGGPSDWKTQVRNTLSASAEAMRHVSRIASALWQRDGANAVRHLVGASVEIGKILWFAGIRIEEYRKHP